MKFLNLVSKVFETHEKLQKRAIFSLNKAITIRNWLIGYHIVKFEQNGSDRAKYGDNLLEKLSNELSKKGTKGFSVRNLRGFRQFYIFYPQIRQTLSAELEDSFGPSFGIFSKELNFKESTKKKPRYLGPTPETLLNHLSFSHFIELLKVENQLGRAFYEIEAIKGGWSIRQLKRQIESLLFERIGLSKNKMALLERINEGSEKIKVEDIIKDPYFFEFTGLTERPEFSEGDLETALLNHIQDFLLELGRGFCFEARQKRISIGNEHNRIDLVFYHRILKCHILIDLKIREFSHGDVGQMNFYLNFFKKQEMKEGDFPPIGIILCTYKDSVKVEFATGGLDNKLFVSHYMVELPSEKSLKDFILRDRERIENKLKNK